MSSYSKGVWEEDEHLRFLDALKRFPHGPWPAIAGLVGTRSARQVQTHAQKYYEKIGRHVRGLQRDRTGGGRNATSREHEIDQEILDACSRALERGQRLPTPARPRGRVLRCRDGNGKYELRTEDDDDNERSSSDDDSELILPLETSLDFLMDLLAGIDDASEPLAPTRVEERVYDKYAAPI